MITEEETSFAEEQDPEVALVVQGERGEILQMEEDYGISIHAITGTNRIHTIKLQGQVKNRTISMLLDSGSTHNFISQALVKELQLNIEPCLPIKVTVTNGENLNCVRKINQFGWRLTQGEFHTHMYVISLGGYDAVLGIQWMQTVSPISLDFEKREVLIHGKGKKR